LSIDDVALIGGETIDQLLLLKRITAAIEEERDRWEACEL
jgi:hypothetical protein